MLTFNKPLIILFLLAVESVLTSHSKDKIVYHKQQVENNICRINDSLI